MNPLSVALDTIFCAYENPLTLPEIKSMLTPIMANQTLVCVVMIFIERAIPGTFPDVTHEMLQDEDELQTYFIVFCLFKIYYDHEVLDFRAHGTAIQKLQSFMLDPVIGVPVLEHYIQTLRGFRKSFCTVSEGFDTRHQAYVAFCDRSDDAVFLKLIATRIKRVRMLLDVLLQ